MYSPFFLTFLEIGWGVLQVLLCPFSASIGLACSLTPLLCLCCILCCPHGPEQENWFQKGAAIPSYAPLSLLPDKCWSGCQLEWSLVFEAKQCINSFLLGFLQGQKPTQSIPFVVLMLNNTQLGRSLRKMHEKKVSFLINS